MYYIHCFPICRIQSDTTCHWIDILSKSHGRKRSPAKAASGGSTPPPKASWLNNPSAVGGRGACHVSERLSYLRGKQSLVSTVNSHFWSAKEVHCKALSQLFKQFSCSDNATCLTIYSSRSAPSSPNQVGMSGLMTPESLSREGSPGPEGIHLHPAPTGSNNGIVLSHGGDHHNQVVASHLEVKTNHFPPGVNPVLTGAQSKFPYSKLNPSKQ